MLTGMCSLVYLVVFVAAKAVTWGVNLDLETALPDSDLYNSHYGPREPNAIKRYTLSHSHSAPSHPLTILAHTHTLHPPTLMPYWLTLAQYTLSQYTLSHSHHTGSHSHTTPSHTHTVHSITLTQHALS